MRNLTRDDLRRLRATAQGLLGESERPADVVEVLRCVCGVQAQVLEAAGLAIRASGSGIRAEDVARANNVERTAVRSWLMRGTLHMIAAEDLGWLLGLLGPLFDRPSKRRLDLGLDPDTCEWGALAIREILGDEGPLTRGELVERLAARGFALDRRSQAPIHLIQHAALQGILCVGPERGDGDPTYAAIEDWLGPMGAIPHEVALGELGRRYLLAYGPPVPEDLAAWSGISVGMAREAFRRISDEIVEMRVEDRSVWMLRDQEGAIDDHLAGATSVRLLPQFDAYLLGYRSRDFAFSAELQERLQRGGGWLHPAIVVDGRGVGMWHLRRERRSTVMEVALTEPLSDEVRVGLDAEVADMGRFLGVEIVCHVTGPEVGA